MGTRASRETSRSEWPWICKVYSWSPRDSRRILEAVMGVNRRLRGRAWNYVQILDIFLTLSSASALNSCLCFHPHCHLVYFQCSSYSVSVKTEVTSGNSLTQNPTVVSPFTQHTWPDSSRPLPWRPSFRSPISSPVPLLLAHCLPATRVSLLLLHCAAVLPCRAFAQAIPLLVLFSQTPTWWFPHLLLKYLFKPHFLYENISDFLLCCNFPHISWALGILLPLVYFSLSFLFLFPVFFITFHL